MSANDDLLDGLIRRDIAIRRFTAHELTLIAELLERADADLVAQLRSRLARPTSGAITTQRIRTLLTGIRDLRRESLAELRRRLADDLRDLAKVEAAAAVELLGDSLPVVLDLASPPAAQLRALVTSSPFATGSGASSTARTLTQALGDLAASDIRRLTGAIQLGVVQGETIDAITRRVVGTRANAYKDGILSVTRREAEAIARTSVHHIATQAREQVFDANSDIIAGRRMVAVLDGRVTDYCRAIDGQIDPAPGRRVPRDEVKFIEPGRRPPFHWQCRTVAVVYFDPAEVADRAGERPFVRDTRTRKVREKDFRAEARDAAGSRWKGMDRADRSAAIKRIRDRWTREMVGQVPAKTNYQDWLSRQTPAFQDDVLGVTRGRLFRDGNLTLDRFIDRRGKTLTLDQLAEREPEAFKSAGVTR